MFSLLFPDSSDANSAVFELRRGAGHTLRLAAVIARGASCPLRKWRKVYLQLPTPFLQLKNER